MKLPEGVKWIDVTRTEIGNINYPAIAQLKLDGELVAWNGYDKVLWNSYGNTKGWIDTSKFPKNCYLFGELYYAQGKDFYKYLTHTTSRNLKVKFFDVISIRGKILYGIKSYNKRLQALQGLTDYIPYTFEIKDNKEALAQFNYWEKKGYEGAVIKPCDSLTCQSWVKLKRTYYDSLLIVGKKKKKRAILVGTNDRVFGAVSMMGWTNSLEKAFADVEVYPKGEDKDHIYFSSGIYIEVRHNGFCGKERESKLRHPRIHRIIGKEGYLTK